jgi:hypothetical protein
VVRNTVFIVLLVAAMSSMGGFVESAHCTHQLGGGIHYCKTLGDIKDTPEWDPDAVAFLVSYRYKMPLIKIEGDLEWVLDYGGSDETMFQPQAWLIIGGMIYGAGGIGGSYIDGDWLDNPFYGLRAGVDLTLAGLNLDCFASYRFQSADVFDDIDQSDLDAITFGAILRFEF